MRDGRQSIPAEFDRLQPRSGAYAPRRVATYLCAREHLVTVPFAVEAAVPETWECHCGQPAALVTTAEPAEPAAP